MGLLSGYHIPTFMVIPSLACQASCKYCFGPHKGATMDEQTAKETVSFIHNIAIETCAKEVSIVFHGGEPLLAPISVWRVLLDEIKLVLADYRVKLNLQSNLWNLTDEFLTLLCENNVSIGTSMDGDKEHCDLNRGEGYYAKTYAAVQKANAVGCSVSAIATITKQTLLHTTEIAKYFRNNNMPMVLHGALAGMDEKDSLFALTSDEYASMIKDLFPWYIKNRKYMQIDTLDNFVRGIVTGNPGVCTFQNCFGMFLSISPIGDITSCQRLAGKNEFSMGNIFDKPTLAKLYQSPAAKAQLKQENQVAQQCKPCEFYHICKGGCYYNAIASGNDVIDPWCEGYKEIYSFVREKVMHEIIANPLLLKGDYISLASGIHPSHLAGNARGILAIHQLGKTNNPLEAAKNLYEQQICGNPDMTEKLLEHMQQGLKNKHRSLNNCYVHVTFDCNLRCKHCYANAGDIKGEMDATGFELLLKESIDMKFRQVVVTGGEPLVHSQRAKLLEICKMCRGRGSNIVLRTNLTGDFDNTTLAALARAFDQVVVSVDGNEQTHNARRGKGIYENIVRNLKSYAKVAADVPNAAELSLACVMSAEDINGEPGQSVQLLGDRLNVKRVRFRPLLPIGRASGLDEPVICEGLMQHVSPDDMLKSAFNPLTTCGIAQNLFVVPDGKAYPCYAWRSEHTYIGNIFKSGLKVVLSSSNFTRLVDCTVDTIDKCRDCEYRYLCGGACRAWGNQSELNLNAAPMQCDHLKQRARKLINTAKEYI